MKLKIGILFFIGLLTVSGCGGGSESGAPAAKGAAVKSPVDPATAGKISGSIKFSGKAPKGKKIAMNADAYCLQQHTSDVLSEEVVVNPNKTLKNVYVYVKSGLGDLKFPVPSEPVIMDQKGCWYHPHVIAVQANQNIQIHNSDGVLHNINAQPETNKGFNFGQPVKGMKTKKKFSKPEVMIPVKCDVHPWMRAYIGVQSHPYAVVTGDDGSFSLENLPPGSYQLEAWHEVYGTQVQTVTLGPSESKSISLTFKG